VVDADMNEIKVDDLIPDNIALILQLYHEKVLLHVSFAEKLL